jgi:hypothetical protein
MLLRFRGRSKAANEPVANERMGPIEPADTRIDFARVHLLIIACSVESVQRGDSMVWRVG